jgi:hypothetical protein
LIEKLKETSAVANKGRVNMQTVVLLADVERVLRETVKPSERTE